MRITLMVLDATLSCFGAAMPSPCQREVGERHALHRGAAAVAGLPRATIGVQRVREVPRLDQLVTFTLLGMSDPVRVHAIWGGGPLE